MSHGDQVQTVAGDFVPLAATDTCPLAAVKHRVAAGLRPAVPPRGQPHAARRADPAELPARRLRLPGPVEDADVHRADRRRASASGSATSGSSAACPAASIRRSCAALLVKAIGPQVACIFVDNGLLREGETEAGPAHVPRLVQGRPARRRRPRPVPVGAGRRHRPAGEAEDHRPRVHRRVQGTRRSRSTDAKFLAQGTLYPDVIESGGVDGRPGGDDQAAPQRRRAAGGAGLRAGRAAARPVQGRGPQARAGTGAAGGGRLAAPVPRPRAGGALPRRGDARRSSTTLRQADAIFLEELKQAGLVPQDGAGVRGAAAGAVGRRDGRRPDLRERGRHAVRCRRTTS